MRPMKRAVHLDFHTLPGIYNFNEGWDAEVFARTLKEAQVEYVNAFARCNIGFAYYPTKVGIPYPGMHGDMFGDLLRECHKRDIGVSAYMNVGIDQEHAVRHPDWLQMDADGRVVRGNQLEDFTYRLLCYNNPDYNDYHFAMLKEICEYDVDGIFFDCLVIQPCYCYHCMKKMREHGIDPYNVSDNMRFQEQSILEFTEKSKEIIGDDKYFLLNGLHYAKYNHLNTHIEVECLPGAWSYDYFWSRASYARTLNDNVLYMTGRFQKSWGDFGGFKTKESLLNDYYDALCAGVGVSVGDHMNPSGNLEKDIYHVVGEMNTWIKELEPYTEKAKFLADIGVVINYERPLPTPGNPWENGTYMPDGYPGLTRMFGELRQSYDIINENMDFGKYRLIVLPDSVKMNDMLKSKLEAYIKNGGKILSSGTSGLSKNQDGFALKEWDFEYEEIDKSNTSYYRFVENHDPKVHNMAYSMYSDSGILMKSSHMLAKYVKSYFQFEWNGIHGYHYTPPEKETGHAAAAVNAKGNVCHIAFEVFKAYNKSASYPHKALVKQCLNILLPQPIIKAEGLPSTARVTATGCEDYTLVHVKVSYPELRGEISVIEEEGILEEGAVVMVKGEFSNVYTLPEKKELSTVVKDGYTQITLPRVVGYQMLYCI